MALNKAHTPVWMKVFIIILIISFIGMFTLPPILTWVSASGVGGLIGPFTNSSQSTQTPAQQLSDVNTKYQAQVDLYKQLATSQPTSYTPQVNLANAYFDWGNEINGLLSKQSQPTTTAMAAAGEAWFSAKAAYDAATKIKADDAPVQTDRSIATFYSGDATAAIVIVSKVTATNPSFAQAWFNLGLFYDEVGRTEDAILAYQKYLALEPKGDTAPYAQKRLDALKSGTK